MASKQIYFYKDTNVGSTVENSELGFKSFDNSKLRNINCLLPMPILYNLAESDNLLAPYNIISNGEFSADGYDATTKNYDTNVMKDIKILLYVCAAIYENIKVYETNINVDYAKSFTRGGLINLIGQAFSGVTGSSIIPPPSTGSTESDKYIIPFSYDSSSNSQMMLSENDILVTVETEIKQIGGTNILVPRYFSLKSSLVGKNDTIDVYIDPNNFLRDYKGARNIKVITSFPRQIGDINVLQLSQIDNKRYSIGNLDNNLSMNINDENEKSELNQLMEILYNGSNNLYNRFVSKKFTIYPEYVNTSFKQEFFILYYEKYEGEKFSEAVLNNYIREYLETTFDIMHNDRYADSIHTVYSELYANNKAAFMMYIERNDNANILYNKSVYSIELLKEWFFNNTNSSSRINVIHCPCGGGPKFNNRENPIIMVYNTNSVDSNLIAEYDHSVNPASINEKLSSASYMEKFALAIWNSFYYFLGSDSSWKPETNSEITYSFYNDPDDASYPNFFENVKFPCIVFRLKEDSTQYIVYDPRTYNNVTTFDDNGNTGG